VTPPENPKDREADKTAVITRPTPESADAAAGGAADKKTADASGGGSPERDTKPAADGAGDKGEGIDPVSLAPPPWRRVSNGLESADAEQVDTVQAAGEPAVQAAVPSEQKTVETPHPAYPPSDPDTVAVVRPVVTGAAASQGLGGNRTSVNLGANTRANAAGPSARRPGRGPRRASLQVKRVDPWSVLKLALVLSVALFFVWLVAIGVLYGVLNGMGVWDKINNTANDLLQNNDPGLISAGRVFGVAAVIGAVNIVLFTALATVSAFIYNVSADLAGGLEVTLSERE
jgi:hypothetical protein